MMPQWKGAWKDTSRRAKLRLRRGTMQVYANTEQEAKDKIQREASKKAFGTMSSFALITIISIIPVP